MNLPPPLPSFSMQPPASLRWSIGLWLLLITLCVAWEWFLAPLRPGGSWLVLKALPLMLAVPGMLRRPAYTLQWASLLVWLYFTEGVVRATSDPGTREFARWLAGAEIGLSLLFFIAAMAYLRPLKRAAKIAAAAQHTITHSRHE